MWTEKDRAIKRLGEELFHAVIGVVGTPGDVLNAALAGIKETKDRVVGFGARSAVRLLNRLLWTRQPGFRVIASDGTGASETRAVLHAIQKGTCHRRVWPC